jgi:gamma-glutamyl-gamma-aminobutyrate hydrolase PuuD
MKVKMHQTGRWLVVASEARSARRYQMWLSHGGIEAIAVFPGDPWPRSPTDHAALLLAGGGDVAPARYGAAPEPKTSGVNEERDHLEVSLIHGFLGMGKPVFGICRGIQILNVALGGGLIQHVPGFLARVSGIASAEPHRTNDGKDATHDVHVERTTRMGNALSVVTTVNSAHHQAIAPDRMAAELQVVCRSPAGIIEAVEGRGRLAAWAVQWHPERLPPDHPASSDLLAFWRRMAAGSSA